MRKLGEDRSGWHRRCWEAFRVHEGNAAWNRPVISLTMNMVAFWVRALLFRCSYKHRVLSSLLDVGDSTCFVGLQASSVWVRDFKHPGFSSLCVQAHLLEDPVVAQMCLAHDVVTLHHSSVGPDGLPVGHFKSYIRRLPVRLEEARGHIADSTWRRFLQFASRPRSRFPNLDELDKLPRAVPFTSAQRTMVDSLYQRFSAPSPEPVPEAVAAVGVSSLVVPSSSVVPVSVIEVGDSDSVIEVGDSDSAASDTGILVSLVSVASSVDTGAPVSGNSRSKRTRHGRRRSDVGGATTAAVLDPFSSVLRDDVVLGIPAPASSEGSLTRRQRRRLNEKAKKAALLDGLPPAPS